MNKQIEDMARDIYMNTSLSVVEIAENIAEHLCSNGYCKASDVAREIFEEIDNTLHDMATEYHQAGHPEYFAVCEMVHHKVMRPIEKKYESEGADGE